MFQIDLTQFKQLERDVKALGRSAYPIANRFALNTTAKEAQIIARAHVKQTMTLRNNFTLQSLQFRTATGNNVTAQHSAVGSTLAYMEQQEFGATKVKRGSLGVAIPTNYAAGDGRGERPRKRVVRGPRRLGQINLGRKRIKAGNWKQLAAIKVKLAVKTNKRFVFLDLNKKRGIFRVSGGSKREKRGRSSAKLDMVYDLTKPVVSIKAHPWLGPTLKTLQPKMPAFWVAAFEYQIKRQQLFKGKR